MTDTKTDYILVPVEPIKRAMVALERFANDTLAGRNSAHELRELLAAAPVVQGEAVEYGWRLIAVNEAWDALERALSRACNKGYMPVTMGAEWNAFDWAEAPQPAEQQPVAHPAITHCDNCGCDWLDNGLNPIGCPYCKQPTEPDEERLALEAVMESVDPATWPGLTTTQRCALSRFAKPQPAEQQPAPDVSALVEALERVLPLHY